MSELVAMDGDEIPYEIVDLGEGRKIYGHHDWLIMHQLRTLKTWYELPLLEFLKEHVQNVDTVVDVGANVGNHTLYFATVMRARVIAVEPNPRAFDALGWTCKGTPTITGILAACSDVDGSGTMDMSDCGHNLGYNIGHGRVQEDRNGTVRVLPLDTLVKDAAGTISIIKIDVEGMEINVLHGAAQTIRKHRPWVCVEVTEDRGERAFLEGLGYTRHPQPFGHTPMWVFKPG